MPTRTETWPSWPSFSRKGITTLSSCELWSDLPKEKEKEERLDTVTINDANLLTEDSGYTDSPVC